MKPYHQLDISGEYKLMLSSAVATTYYNFLNAGTHFGDKVYSSGILDIDEITSFYD